MRLGGASNHSLMAILEKSFQDYKILTKQVSKPIFALLLKNLRKINQFLT
jgi:hypothetical protein